jgi:hypothetical protein
MVSFGAARKWLPVGASGDWLCDLAPPRATRPIVPAAGALSRRQTRNPRIPRSIPTIREIANFLWEIADEILRDDFKRSKYPDVILPFVVLRR